MCALPVGKLPGHLLREFLEELSLDDDVIVGPGIGRDAAAVRLGDWVLVLKTDPVTFPTSDAGWYLVNVNANDIACMGAEPRWLLVTALLPENETTAELAESIFTSLQQACTEIGCSLIGGHTEITEGLTRPILVGQMVGIASEESLIDPTGAEAGDAVLLIGGIAVEGTSILATEACAQLRETVDTDLLSRAARFSRNPGISVVPYARRLLEVGTASVKAMHDPTEGGLATGLHEIAEATGLGIEVNNDAIHIYPETKSIADALGLDPWGLIASGALLAVVAPENVDAALERLGDLDVPASQIGRLTSDPTQRTLIVDGSPQELPTFAVDEIARYFSED
jgi:hydrogenase expression/formation protein HypE